MKKRMIFCSFLLAISALAHGAPGVWEQMQNGQITSARGIVKSIDIIGSEVYFKAQTRNAFGDPVVRDERLCGYNDGLDDPRESEEVRAAMIKTRIETLQEARRSGHAIEFGTKGIWKSCVSFLRTANG